MLRMLSLVNSFRVLNVPTPVTKNRLFQSCLQNNIYTASRVSFDLPLLDFSKKIKEDSVCWLMEQRLSNKRYV